MPLSSGNGLSFRSNKNPHRSTSGMGDAGYLDSVGILGSLSWLCDEYVQETIMTGKFLGRASGGEDAEAYGRSPNHGVVRLAAE